MDAPTDPRGHLGIIERAANILTAAGSAASMSDGAKEAPEGRTVLLPYFFPWLGSDIESAGEKGKGGSR